MTQLYDHLVTYLRLWCRHLCLLGRMYIAASAPENFVFWVTILSVMQHIRICSCFTLDISLPVTVAERSKACSVLARSEARVVGSNPTQGMDVWYVCVCLWVGGVVVLCTLCFVRLLIMIFFLLFSVGWYWDHLVRRPLLAYCTNSIWWWWWWWWWWRDW
jgi:hypothetical protein